MNNNKSVFKNLISILFIAIIFIVFAINLFEVYKNLDEHKTEISLSSLANDLDGVDAILYPCINVNGFYQAAMLRNYIYDANPANDILKNDKGQLMSVSSNFSKEDVVASADELKKTSDYLANKGIPLLYVQAASKNSFSPDDAITGITNYTYAKYQVFDDELDNNSIDYINTTEYIDDPATAFYKTDHHWTTQTCLDIAKLTCQHLNDKYNFDLDISKVSRESYNFIPHSNSFLGAEGRRTGRWYTGLDNFTLITPTFKTDLDLSIIDAEGESFERSGSFSNTIIDYSKDISHYSFEDSAYYSYWGGDYGYIHGDNKVISNGKKALIIKDSYGIPVTAFMSYAFDSFDILDLRYVPEDLSIKELIDKNNPDVVIFIYGPGYLNKKSMFSID